MSLVIRNIIVRILDIVLAFIVLFLGLRIILKLLSANQATPFVSWIYEVSESLIASFRGIFTNPTFGSGREFDLVALISLVAYSVLAYLISALISSFVGGVHSHASHGHI